MVYSYLLEARLHTDPIAHRSDCTLTRLRTDSIAYDPIAHDPIAQTQSDAITIEKTGKILVDDEKT